MSTKPFSTLRDALFEESPDSRHRVAKEVERLEERIGLADLRKRLNLTQTDLAKSLGTSQPGVSRIESQDDAMVSTVRDYVHATGGGFALLAAFPDAIYELALGRDEGDREGERQFRIVWQDQTTRKLIQVGRLQATPHHYIFHYTTAAETEPSFRPFTAFPDLRTTYQSSRLWPFFTDALVNGVGIELDRLVDIFSLPDKEAGPIELLSRGVLLESNGRSPDLDVTVIQVIPEPVLTPDGEESLFLASGLRHVGPEKDVNESLAALQTGDRLELVDDPENSANPRAVALRGPDGQNLGYIPDHLLDYLHKRREAANIEVSVVQVAGPEVENWHLRLLCRIRVVTSVP